MPHIERNKLFLVTILVVAAFLRLWQLGAVPVGVTNDELGYIYNAYSVAKTGSNVFGEHLPFLTWMIKGSFPFLPVPIYFSVPFFWAFPLSAFTGRLPAAILGIIDVYLLYILVQQLFQKRNLALLSAFFLAISPWHLHFSRSAYDTNYSLFFFLLGLVLYIFEIEKKKMPFFSLLCFLLAIFSYRAMNIIFVPLVVVLFWYGYVALKIQKRQAVVFFTGVFVILLSLLVVILINGKGYTAEANIFNDPKMQESLDTQIREAKGPLFVRRLFLNKFTYAAYRLRENYLKGYSPDFLFLYTEPSKIYSIWSRGRIYFIDAIFIFLGIIYLYKEKRKQATFIFGMVLIGGLPGMLGGFPYSSRNFFLAAFLPLLVAGGVLFATEVRHTKKLVIGVIIVMYLYSFGSYVFDYYGRYAYYGAEAWAKSLKDVSTIILSSRTKFNEIVVGRASFVDFIQYAFYTNLEPRQVQKSWKEQIPTNEGSIFKTQNVRFIPGCLNNSNDFKLGKNVNSLLYFVHEECHKSATPSSQIRDYAGNTIWKVYEVQRK